MFRQVALGQWTEGCEFKVDLSHVVAYAGATNDSHPLHAAGVLAPPVFGIIPALDAAAPWIQAIVPEEALRTVLFGESDMHLHRPIRPGRVLWTRAAPWAVSVKPSGTTLVIKTESSDETGVVNEQYMTFFFRGVDGGWSDGDLPPDHRLPEEVLATAPAAERAYGIDIDQTYRYAEASGDHHPAHKDPDFARSVGLPGIIVHGMCSLAFASRAVIDALCDGRPERLARLAVRFAQPVFPGQQLTTRMWALEGAGRHGFVGVADSAVVALKDGLAEVRPA